MKAFHRRDFLKFGSIAALGVAAGALLERSAFADPAPLPLRLSVGCAGIDEVDRARRNPFDVVLAPADYDRLTARDRFLAAVEEGLADVKAGRVVSDEELDRDIGLELQRVRSR